MKIQKLLTGKFTIAGVIETKNSEEHCPPVDFLDEIDSKYQKTAGGMYALIALIAENGLQNISSKLCHRVDEKNKIYELIKGDLRIFFFKGNKDLIIIATHGIIKKSQKTKQTDIDKAVKYKRRYQKAHDTNDLTIIEAEEEE